MERVTGLGNRLDGTNDRLDGTSDRLDGANDRLGQPARWNEWPAWATGWITYALFWLRIRALSIVGVCNCWCVRFRRVLELLTYDDDLCIIPLLVTVDSPSPHLHFLHESMARSHGSWVWEWDEGRKGWWLAAAWAAAAGAQGPDSNGGSGWVWDLSYELFVGSTCIWWGGWLGGQNRLVNCLGLLSLLSNEEAIRI